jgi:hypothetical protein
MTTSYDPAFTPDRLEAERDLHADEEARGRCRPSAPCSACLRAFAARGRR